MPTSIVLQNWSLAARIYERVLPSYPINANIDINSEDVVKVWTVSCQRLWESASSDKRARQPFLPELQKNGVLIPVYSEICSSAHTMKN